MKIFKTFPAFLAIVLLLALCAPPALALDGPELSAKAVLLADLDSGAVLFERNMLEQRSPASLTKVMTLLLALEAVDRGEASLDDAVTAGADCRSGMRDDSSSVGITQGETLLLEDLLYCAAVASGNDACNVIAVHISGSIPAFVERMNRRAEELGCSQTRFVDPHGLSSEDLSCALDLYRITREALSHPAFAQLCDCVDRSVPATNKSGVRELHNSNALISPNGIYGPDYLYEGAHGVKTGYTRAAGYCLISTAERNGMRLLCIVLGCDGPYLSDTSVRRNFTDSIRVYDWAFLNFSPTQVYSAGELLGYAEVSLAAGDKWVGLRPLTGLSLPLPEEAAAGRELRLELNTEEIVAPVRAGQVLGTARFLLDGRELICAELAADRDVPLSIWAYVVRTVTETRENGRLP